MKSYDSSTWNYPFPHPPPWFPPKPSSIWNQAGPAQDPCAPRRTCRIPIGSNRQCNSIGNSIGNSIAILWFRHFIIFTYLFRSFSKFIMVPNWPHWSYDQLSAWIRNHLPNLFRKQKKRWIMKHVKFICVIRTPRNWQTIEIIHFYDKQWLCVIGFALVYYVGVNERENPISGMEMFQSNIYYCKNKKVYCVYTRNLLCIHKTNLRLW